MYTVYEREREREREREGERERERERERESHKWYTRIVMAVNLTVDIWKYRFFRFERLRPAKSAGF